MPVMGGYGGLFKSNPAYDIQDGASFSETGFYSKCLGIPSSPALSALTSRNCSDQLEEL